MEALILAQSEIALNLTTKAIRKTLIKKLLKRKKPQEVPYYLKSPAEKRKRPRIGLNAPRHNTDDDLDETAEQAETESLSAKQGFAARAAVYLVAGMVMLALSAI